MTIGKGGGGTNTTTSSNAPPQEVLDQYKSIIARANTESQQPLEQYQGPIVAGFTPAQQQAFQGVQNAQGLAQPYYNQAQGLIQQGSQAITPTTVDQAAIDKYQNPYTQDVINSTLANINQQNAGQQQQLMGNAISQGAWGGDRSAVAQALLANQQDLAKNQTIAGLQNQSYSQALGEANTQQAQDLAAQQASRGLAQQGGYGMANLGTTAQNEALTGAGALGAVGNQQQQQAQANLNVPYEQFLQQQAYPFQNLSWLSSISTGLGSGMGGTSTTTQPAPNSIFGFERGGGVREGLIKRLANGGAVMMPGNYDGGGLVRRLAAGGNSGMGMIPGQTDFLNNGIPDVSVSYLPGATTLTKGSGIPQPPKPQEKQSGVSQIQSGLGVANSAKGLLSSSSSPSHTSITPSSGMPSSDFNNFLNSMDFSNGTGGMNETLSPELLNADPSLAESSPTWLAQFGDYMSSFFNKGGAVPSYSSGGLIKHMASGGNSGNNFGAIPDIAQNGWDRLLPDVIHAIPQIIMALNRGGEVKGYADGGDTKPSLLDVYPDDMNDIPSPSLPAAPIVDNTPSQGLIKADQSLAPAADASSKIFTPTAPINDVNPWLSVLAGVAGAASGKSPYVLQNFAGGLSAGLSDYGSQKKEAAEESYKQGTIEDARDNLAREAEQHKDTIAMQKEQLGETSRYHEGELAKQNAALDLQRQQVEQGKVASTPGGLRYFTSGKNAGQAVPNQEQGTNAQLFANNIGIPLVIPTGRENIKNSDDAIRDAGNAIGASNDGITSLQRVKTLLPTIDQGKMAEASRYIQKAVGSGSTVEDATNQALPPGTPERAAYEEMQKLEMNAALQNEVANGVKGRALGINMVNLGQKMFASPEMSKVAQENIIDKALFTAQMAKNANEVIVPFEGHSIGTLTAAKQKYYNDSIAAGYAIPTEDYLSGSWKKEGYTPTGVQKYSATGNNAITSPSSLPPKDKLEIGKTYPTSRGAATWNGSAFIPVAP